MRVFLFAFAVAVSLHAAHRSPQSPPCSLTAIVTSSVRRNKGAALLNLNEAPSSPLHVRMQSDKPALVQREASFFFTFTLQKTKVLLSSLLFRQPHTEAGTISDVDAFGALLINVPTTAIFLLRYAEHSNVFLLFIASQEVMVVLNAAAF